MTIITHSQHFLKMTGNWFNNQATSDLEVRLKNDKAMHCHRLVLSSWSDVWAAALQDEKESSMNLLSHDAPTVEMCLKYCYTSSIDLTEANLTKVHLFAHQYNLKALEVDCEQMLARFIKQPTAANCMGLYCYFLEHEFPNLPNAVQSIRKFACQEFVDASKSNEFLRLPVKALCQLLKDSRLNAPEDDVLDACCRWLASSPVGNDPQVRERVMQLVRLPMLSPKKLLEFKVHPMMAQSASLPSRYLFALEYMMTQHVPESDQQPLRIKLTEENKLEILTPRTYIPSLTIQSQILDADMAKTLCTMFAGQRRVARLLVSGSNLDKDEFKKAVTGQSPFVCIIKSSTDHVFGAYVEDALGPEGSGDVPGSPNNFLFSLKAIPPQEVVKLSKAPEGNGIYIKNDLGLHMGDEPDALAAFNSYSTADNPAFELAPGYEAVGSKTLHGEFGDYTLSFVEVFALPL